ncbi:hypothetical protein [Rhodohalobacter mucosus]|uniref:VWA domain-containing protein n=1 Tax=Rhodohalobacter mucosus TaxID=2079485 RepID=A0A316TUR2_9BACT|nr:hypothetical protein [Rhodohalobacter mucosus]PWN07598.1 hypothetical protein DDZ15_04900 [Rhodohalobacter mucosus]
MISVLPEGFSPALPVLIIILLVILSLFVSWWSYKSLEDQSRYIKPLLITLRTLSLLILCALLFNPYVTRQQIVSTPNEVAVFIDNSSSILVERGSYEGESDFRSAYDAFLANRPENLSYPVFQFGDYVREDNEPDFSDPSTNIQQVTEYLLENGNRFSAAVLFSDGIITRGRNPVFQAQSVTVPLITVPLGDTTLVRDISVAEIEYTDPIYTNTIHRITVEIRHRGYENVETDIVLYENGVPADRKTIQFPSSSGTEWIDFDRSYANDGFVNLTVSAEPVDGEFTEENNRASAAFRVLDNKTRILSIAYEIMPDVASVRRLIATDRQYELLQSTYLGNGRYAGESLSGINPDDIDLLVIHGLPVQRDSNLNRLLNSDTSVLFMSTPGSYSMIGNYQQQSPALFEFRGSDTELTVLPAQDTTSVSHPLMELTPLTWNRLPSLTVQDGEYQMIPGTEVHLWGQSAQKATEIPLLVSADYGNKRVANLNAYGWNRYDLSTQSEVSQFFEEIVTNIISWGSSANEDRLLILEPLRDTFTELEQVQFRASLINERGEREPNASISLTLTRLDQNTVPVSFQMRHLGDGNYELNAGRYPSGIYSARGRAVAAGREIDVDETRFTIGSVNEEMIDTRRNSALLQQLAAVTGGYYEENAGSEKLSEFLEEISDQNNTDNTVTETDYLYRNGIWFFIAILLLTAEWMLRRKISLP